MLAGSYAHPPIHIPCRAAGAGGARLALASNMTEMTDLPKRPERAWRRLWTTVRSAIADKLKGITADALWTWLLHALLPVALVSGVVGGVTARVMSRREDARLRRELDQS